MAISTMPNTPPWAPSDITVARSAPSVNSSGRQDGHARLLGYRGKEFMQRGVTTDMAAGFDALDDQDLRSGMFHRTRLGERPHLTYDDDLGIAQPLHQRKRHVPKQTHDGDAEFDAR